MKIAFIQSAILHGFILAVAILLQFQVKSQNSGHIPSSQSVEIISSAKRSPTPTTSTTNKTSNQPFTRPVELSISLSNDAGLSENHLNSTSESHEDVDSSSNDFEAPVLIFEKRAPYPNQAKQESLSGQVILSLTISPQGIVTELKLIEAAGHGFDEAAIKALKESKFSPARWKGHPIPYEIRYTYLFNLHF